MALRALEARGWRRGQDFRQDDDGTVVVLSEALRLEMEQRRGQANG